MIQYNNYYINKNNVSLIEYTQKGEYLVYLNNGKVISVDETTFNLLKQ